MHKQQDNDANMDIPLPTGSFCVPLESSDAVAFNKATSGQNLRVVPMQDFASQTSQGSIAGAMVHVKGKVYAQCQKKVVAMLTAETQKGLPGMGLDEQQLLVNRFASQLAAWAVYGEMPADLKQAIGKARADDVFTAVGAVPAMSRLSSQQGIFKALPALLKGNRQRDALFMLQAEAGIIKGPLPETNLAYRDAQSQGLGVASQAQEAAHQDVVASLAQKLLGADQRGQPKPLARVLMRARDLTADGVLVSRDLRQDQHAHDMAECILVCSQEAEQMLKDQRSGEEEEESSSSSSSSGHHQTDTKQLLKAWTSARQDIQKDTTQRRKLPDQNAMHVMFTTGRPENETGYEISDRAAYYRQPIPKAGLPRRVGLPVRRDMMTAFMQRHRATMDNVAMWRMAMDAVFPTCPMVNILVDGPMPYHMSGHAMLEEYMTLIRFASDRVASPGGVRPVAPTMAEVWMRDEDVTKVKIKAQASLLAFSPLRAKVTDWNGLPDWCGKWFLPLAYMARPRSHAEFNLLYPEGTLERQTLGKVWMNTKGDIPASVLLECFDQGCNRVEAVDAKKKGKEKALTKVVEDEETDMEIDARTCSHCHQKRGDHLHDCPQRIMDSQQKMEKVIADREKELSQPDRSKPGRAETLMVLSAMRAYYGLLQASIAHHDAAIEAIRTRYGPGVNCGNGFDAVRPAQYYEELWQAGLQYTTATLEIHEMTLLLIHGRWVDTDKLRSRLVGAQTRLCSAAINHANGLTVDRAVAQRTKALRRRMAVDGRYSILSKGLAKCPDRDGRFVSSNGKTDEKPKWLLERVRGKKGIRSDAPTYEEMILFDHLMDYVPLQHEADQAMKGLVARTQAMTVHSAAEAARNPEAAEIQHAMPIGQTASETGENDKRGRQKEENGVRPKPIRVKRTRNVSTHSVATKANGGGASDDITMQVDN